MASRASSRVVGVGSILLAVGFNLPYAVLAMRFDYPGILRDPPEVILGKFAAGGPSLVATWYAFALAALFLIPVGLGLALGSRRAQRWPGLAIAAAVLGALAGLTQAMGLLRWVMVVPGLAAMPDGASHFAVMHAYAGVAIGEHLGMLLTAAFVGTMAALQWRGGRRAVAATGGLTAATVAVGAFEGLAMALGVDGGPFGLGAVLGYLLLTLWLAWEGFGLAGLRWRGMTAPA